MWRFVISTLVGAIPAIIDAIAKNVRASKERKARIKVKKEEMKKLQREVKEAQDKRILEAIEKKKKPE
jgi:uncharacterized membrane protein (DUF106 family)